MNKAHYFIKPTKVILITEGPHLNRGIIATIPVKDKREARSLAAQYNAEPWNF